MAAPLDEREREVWRAFLMMRRQLELTLERRLQADAGISNADYDILISLFSDKDKRLRAGHIGDLLGWEKSRVSHQLSRMSERGLIERERAAGDARGVWVTLTADGSRAVLAATRDRSEAVREHFFDVVSPEEQQAILDVSHRVLGTINPPICEDAEESDD